MARTLYTVRAVDLRHYADQLERDANGSLRAWIILGQTDRYGAELAAARALRAAAATRSIWTRREILRNAGFELKPARAAA